MNFFDYAFHHIGCVARLLRGDGKALGDMDISADGFWRSFEAIPAALPALVFAWVFEARQIQASGKLDSLSSMIARMAVLEIVFWIAPLVVLAFVLRPLKLGHRFPHLVISRNWLSALLSYVFVAVSLIELVFNAGQTSNTTALLALITMGLMLWFSVTVTRVALNVPQLTAVAFVAVETLVTYPLAVFAYGAAGLYPAA
ncbi:MAG: hypothetical protein WAU86_24205 [Oricola sp.]